MVDITRYLNILRGTEYFRQNFSKFKDAFIKYYGEEQREYIEEQFSNATFFTVISPRTVKVVLSDTQSLICYDLVDEAIVTSGYDFTREDIVGFSAHSFPTFKPIDYFIKMYDLLKSGREQRERDFYEEGYEFIKGTFKEITREQYDRFLSLETLPDEFEQLPEPFKSTLLFYRDKKNADHRLRKCFDNCECIIKKIDVNITFEELEDYVEDLEEVYELFKETISKYDEAMKPLQPHFDEMNKYEEEQARLDLKYHRQLVSENIDLLPEEDRETALKYINGECSIFNLSEVARDIVSYKIDIDSFISSFSTKSSELLDDPNASEWKVESICKDRIAFLNKLGIDYGSDYSRYITDPKAIELIKKYGLIADKIAVEREKLKAEFYNELLTYYNRHVEIRSEIDKLGLLNRDDCFGSNLYAGFEATNTFVSPNAQMTESGIRMHNLLALGLDYYRDGYVDHIICHELNHLYELGIISMDDKGFDFCCGWDFGRIDYTSEVPIVSSDSGNKKREYELFNEIINELIAQEVSQIMIDDGNIIFDSPSNVKYKGFTSYEHTRILVLQFLREFKDVIIQSRRHGNYQLIFDTVGKENFDALNQLVIEFTNNFSGFTYYSLLDSKKKGEENDLTRLFDSFIAKRDEIMARMREFREQKSTAQGPTL